MNIPNVQIKPFLSNCKTKLDIPYISELSIRKNQVELKLNNLVLCGKIIDSTGRLNKFGSYFQEELLFTVNYSRDRLVFIFIAVIDSEHPIYMEIDGKECFNSVFPVVKISEDQKLIVSEIFKKIKSQIFLISDIERKNYWHEYKTLMHEL